MGRIFRRAESLSTQGRHFWFSPAWLNSNPNPFCLPITFTLHCGCTQFLSAAHGRKFSCSPAAKVYFFADLLWLKYLLYETSGDSITAAKHWQKTASQESFSGSFCTDRFHPCLWEVSHNIMALLSFKRTRQPQSAYKTPVWMHAELSQFYSPISRRHSSTWEHTWFIYLFILQICKNRKMRFCLCFFKTCSCEGPILSYHGEKTSTFSGIKWGTKAYAKMVASVTFCCRICGQVHTRKCHVEQLTSN